MSEHDNCPKCGVSLIGDPIPEKDLIHYSGTHWRREIGIDGGSVGIYDGVVALRCPDCEHEWARSDSEWGQGLFDAWVKYKEESNEKK